MCKDIHRFVERQNSYLLEEEPSLRSIGRGRGRRLQKAETVKIIVLSAFAGSRSEENFYDCRRGTPLELG